MRKLLFECNSGISGDMTVAALLDLGVDQQYLLNALNSLHVCGYHIHVSKTSKCGISATDFDVHLELEEHGHTHHNHDEHEHSHENHTHEHRNLDDITRIIYNSEITKRAKETAVKLFRIVAEAEAEAHGLPIDQVHFHEVGAIDSIVDIVAVAVCLDVLDAECIYCSGVSEGQGSVKCQHGILPVPVPAVANIFMKYGMQMNRTDNNGEMITPTGASILAGAITSWFLPPKYRIVRQGIGAGKKDFEQANVLRVFEIETEEAETGQSDQVVLIETNIDDLSPEILGYSVDLLLQSGAKDVWTEPIYMKKNRAAVKLCVLCDENQVLNFTRLILENTSSIGVRYRFCDRIIMNRTIETVHTEYGEAKVKHCTFEDIDKTYVEYETAKITAEKAKIPLDEMYRAIYKAIR